MINDWKYNIHTFKPHLQFSIKELPTFKIINRLGHVFYCQRICYSSDSAFHIVSNISYAVFTLANPSMKNYEYYKNMNVHLKQQKQNANLPIPCLFPMEIADEDFNVRKYCLQAENLSIIKIDHSVLGGYIRVPIWINFIWICFHIHKLHRRQITQSVYVY